MHTTPDRPKQSRHCDRSANQSTIQRPAMEKPVMKRRTLMASVTAALAHPRLSRAQSKRTLRFIPQADLSILDPH